MANTGSTVTYTSTVTTANPAGAAVTHVWSLPNGGGTITGNTPSANQAVVVWGNTTGTFIVRDVVTVNTNGCAPVTRDLSVQVTNNSPQYWSMTLCSDGSNATATLFDPNGNYDAGTVIKNNSSGICYTLVALGNTVGGINLNYGDISEHGDCAACLSSGGNCIPITSVTIN